MFEPIANSDKSKDLDHTLLTTDGEVKDLAQSWNKFSTTITLPTQQFSWISMCDYLLFYTRIENSRLWDV
jgi:hypothetical protein